MVEHSAVNRRVVGSSPTRGATPRDCPNEVREGPVATSECEVVRDCESSAKACEARLAKPAQQGLACKIRVNNLKKLWPGGQEVKTSPFHGGNTGSIPVRVTYMDA